MKDTKVKDPAGHQVVEHLPLVLHLQAQLRARCTSPASIASIARSMVGRESSASSCSENQRSVHRSSS